MYLSSHLFSTSHSVEQLVNIKTNKKVDKVLLKVIRTIRSKGNLDGWVKPEANLKTDLKLSDKIIDSIKRSLGEYYHLDIAKNKTLMTATAITNYIKTNKPEVKDSIFLVNAGDTEEDSNNEVQTDNEMEDPNVINPKPVEAPPAPAKEPGKEITIQEPVQPTIAPEEQVVVTPVTGDKPEETLEPSENEVTENTEPDDAPADEQVPEEGTTVSTEALAPTSKKITGRYVWMTIQPEDRKGKVIAVGEQWGPVFSSKGAATKYYMSFTKHLVKEMLVAIPFNFIKKYLKKMKDDNEHAGGGIYIVGPVKIPVAICVFDKLPTVHISKESLEFNPNTVITFADVLNDL